ncbi:hypothetical protein J6590_012066 [Homalodisca vitripennis]|nr:hypothetical protein J6590_012066 [Homalodisca vitripennis]
MVTLLCPVTGDPKPTVTWSKLDSLVTSKVNEDGSVMLNNLTPADTGTYLCSATNVAGSAVLPVSLDVMVKPVITDWQTEVSVLEGELLTLSCESEGKPSPSITWHKEERLLTSHGPIYQTTAKKEDAGNYTCKAENKYGVDQQQLAVIVIVPAQIMNNEEENVLLFSNTSETKLVCLIDGIPQPVVSWLKDSVVVKEKDDHRLRPENNILTITNGSQDLAGMYICHVENIAGIAQKMFEVEFYEPPKILEQSPTNITLRERDDYTIPCSAAGTPTPVVKWRRHEMALLPGFQTDEMVIMQDNMLVLTQVTSASEGQYVCEADSPAGHAHRNYSVHVIVPPVVVDKSVTPLDIVESNEGLLTCPVQQGSHQSSVVWLKTCNNIWDCCLVAKNGGQLAVAGLDSIQRMACLAITEPFPSAPGVALASCLNLAPLDIVIRTMARRSVCYLQQAGLWLALGCSRVSILIQGNALHMISDQMPQRFSLNKPFRIVIPWSEGKKPFPLAELEWVTDDSKAKRGTGAGIVGVRTRP